MYHTQVCGKKIWANKSILVETKLKLKHLDIDLNISRC